MLQAMRLEPNVVVQLFQRQDDATERYSRKKIDPITGIEYNTSLTLIDVDVKKRLRGSNQKPNYVANGFASWNNNLNHVEDYFGENLEVVNVPGASVSQTNQAISEIIFTNMISKKFEFTLKN